MLLRTGTAPGERHRCASAAWAAVIALCLPCAAAHATGSEATIQDVLSVPLPGRTAQGTMLKSLETPTEATRWRGLERFGADLFTSGGLATPAENAPVGPDYVLGPGDELRVFVSGLRDTSMSLPVDREGKIVLPRVGSTFVWGLSFADAEALVAARLASVLRNANVHVSMGRLRAIDVFVLGAVAEPGRRTLSGHVTALHALAAAGGPSTLGSMRDVRVMRANREVAAFDLYPFLLAGDRAGDPVLQSGDVVFVGLATGFVGIQGAVRRPGVFEARGEMTLKALLDMAGGVTPFADVSRIQIERVDANGGFRIQDMPLNHGRGIDPDSLLLSPYDLVTVLSLNERIHGVVTLDGFVRHPGEYELTGGMRLSALVTAERLLPEASLEHAELRRIAPGTFAIEVVPFSIRAVWAGEGDVALRPLDAVTVFSSARVPRAVTLEGEIERPGVYPIEPGERLSTVLARAGGVTARGWLPAAVFTRRRVVEREREIRRELAERQRVDLAREQLRFAQEGDSAAAAAVTAAQRTLDQAMLAQGAGGRVVLELDARGRWVAGARDPVLEDGDVLVVPVRPTTVSVIGSVMNPGTVMATRGGSFQSYLQHAGGATRDADLGRSYVLRANGAAVPRRAAGRVEPGDAIVVPARDGGRGAVGRAAAGATRWALELATAAALILAATR